MQQPSRTKGQSTLSSVEMEDNSLLTDIFEKTGLWNDEPDLTAALKTISDTWKQAYDENGCSKDAPMAVHKRILLKMKMEL